MFRIFGKSILQVPDTGTQVLDNTGPFLCSSIVSFSITLACSKECKYHIFRQYWYTKNVPVLTNTGAFQYLGPEVYFFPKNVPVFTKTGTFQYLGLEVYFFRDFLWKTDPFEWHIPVCLNMWILLSLFPHPTPLHPILLLIYLKGHWTSSTSSPNFFQKKLGFLYH